MIHFDHRFSDKTVNFTFFNCLLYGFLFQWFYFLYHRCYNHFIMSFILFWFSFGVTGLIYPFFAFRVLREHYILDPNWSQIIEDTNDE